VPRDLIEFFNSIIEHASGKATLTQEMIFDGESLYSKNRMRSLGDEWISDYPSLIECSTLLKQRPNVFRLTLVSQAEVEEFCLNYSINNRSAARSDLPTIQARAVVEGIISWESFICSTMHVFYITGLVGLKTEAFESYQWSHQGPTTIVADTINMQTSVMIHPMFYRVLGIKP
jgi:hypothetical protein